MLKLSVIQREFLVVLVVLYEQIKSVRAAIWPPLRFLTYFLFNRNLYLRRPPIHAALWDLYNNCLIVHVTTLFSGVFDVSLRFKEHKDVGVKTTNVPYVVRPGKVPTPPATRVFTSPADVASDAIKRAVANQGHDKSMADFKMQQEYI